MGKIKIHEIAKKIGVNSKDIIEQALKLGIEAKTHLSGVDEKDAKKIEEKLMGGKKDSVEKLFDNAQSIIDRAVVKGVMRKNTAGRRKAMMSRRVKEIMN